MKPDKHKKKKNEEYKKKHGIQRQGNQIGKGSRPELSNENNIGKMSNVTSTKDDHDSELSEDDELISEGQFLTNEVDVIDELAGEDIDDILKETAHTCFQYQYQQKSFVDEIGDYTGTSEQCLDIVSVDYSILSQLLHCIPLYKRLGLEEDIFEVRDLEIMRERAKETLSSYKSISDKNTKVINTSSKESLEKLFNVEIPPQNAAIEEHKKVDKILGELRSENTSAIGKKSNPDEKILKESYPLSQIDQSSPMQTSAKMPKNNPTISNLKTLIRKTTKSATIEELEDELDELLKL